MILDAYGNPLTPLTTPQQRARFAQGGGQGTRAPNELGPLMPIMAERRAGTQQKGWKPWRLDFFDEAEIMHYTVQEVMDIATSISTEVSQALWHLKLFSNPYFWFEMEYESRETELELERILDNITQIIGGWDAIMSQIINGIFILGEAVLELVLTQDASEGEYIVVQDPTGFIFKQEKHPRTGSNVWGYGQYIMGQYKSFLFDPTVIFIGFQPGFGPPRGRAIMESSLYIVLSIMGFIRDIRRVIANQGYPRLDIELNFKELSALYAQLKASGEVTSNFNEWVTGEMDTIRKLYAMLKPDEAFVHLDGVKVNPHPGALNQSMSLFNDLFDFLGRQAANGLHTNWVLQNLRNSGSWGSKESDVMWEIYGEGIGSIQQLISIAASPLFNYALRLKGDPNRVWMHYGEVNESLEYQRAQTRQLHLQNAGLQLDYGLASLEEVRNELQEVQNENRHFRSRTERRRSFQRIYQVSGTFASQRPGGSGCRDCSETSDGTCTRHEDGATLSDGSGWEASGREAEETAVQISPEGSDEALPELPGSVAFSDADASAARRVWNQWFVNYRHLLSAAVEGATAIADGFEEIQEGDWRWSATSHRYRNGATGAAVTENRLKDLRDQFISRHSSALQRFTSQLRDGELTVQELTLALRRMIKKAYLTEYALARGGMNALTVADVGDVARHVRRQWEFLQNFMEQTRNGELSVAQIRSRARLYVHSATQAFERAHAANYGVELPEYPADGNQICLSNCKCHWRIVRNDDGSIDAHWLVNVAAEHCESCRENAAKWNPYTIPAPESSDAS